MADQTEDISSFEDIGERLDDLLDALEVSTQEVAQTGSSLDQSLDELAAAQVASQGDAVVGDSGAVSPPASSKPTSDPKPEPEPESEPEPEAEVQHEDQAQPEPEAEAGSGSEPVAATEPEPEVAPSSPDSADDAEVHAEPEEPTDEADAPADNLQDEEPKATDPVPEPVGDDRKAPPTEDARPAKAQEDESALLDDGLLIEPEAKDRAEDIDGAPAGPVDLEGELDEELDALLASGMFEDPLADLGPDESATPVDLPEPSEQSVESNDADAEEDRKANLPTDEAELIGELDEQLAALADSELNGTDEAEPAPEPEPAVASTTEASAARAEASPEAKPATAEPAAAAAPHAEPADGWKARLGAIVERSRPVVERSWARVHAAMIAGATRANAPLKDKPHLKQVVGWVALVHVFYAACLWAYVTLWHNPPMPPPTTQQPTLESTESP